MCAEILWRMRVKKYPASTIKEVLDYIRENGYVCYYTGMSLDRDPRSLYNHFKKHTKVIKKKPIYWVRLYPKVKCLEGDV